MTNCKKVFLEFVSSVPISTCCNSQGVIAKSYLITFFNEKSILDKKQILIVQGDIAEQEVDAISKRSA